MLVNGHHGAIATSQVLASEVGRDLLQRGGSAVDAAIGANAMLSLIEPFMCGPGGDLFALVWDPASRAVHGLNASGRAPIGQTLAQLQARLGSARTIPIHGPHSVTVPGAVRGWQALHARFGRLSLSEIFAPVIEHAVRGVTIGKVTATWWQLSAAAVLAATDLGQHALGFKQLFLLRQGAPRAGDVFRNLALGNFYQRLAQVGFDDFYQGSIAAELAAYLRASGSAIATTDLTQASAQWVEPITTRYRDHDVYELPPNGQGLAVIQMLNLLERYPLAQYGLDQVEYRHLFIEAKKLAFEDRAHYYADPEFATVPIAALADKGYAATRAALIGAQANPYPVHGDAAIAHGDTTYLAVADADGMMVSLIQSVFQGFGAGLAPPSLGFPLQCRGAGFALVPNHPNCYAPGKRPFHTIIPAFVMQDGEPVMAFGVMGGDVQPQGQVQILVNQIDFGMDPYAAGLAPRLRHDGTNHPHAPSVADTGVVLYEAGCPESLLAALRARGHVLQEATHPVLHFMGGYQCVRRAGAGYVAASEPRFDGCALAY